jgi:hypothetical protein
MTYYLQLYVNLTKHDIKLDFTLCQVHFKNWYIDLDDLQIKQRKIGIDSEYIPSTIEQQNISN